MTGRHLHSCATDIPSVDRVGMADVVSEMKKIICWLFDHRWEPYEGDFMDPYCVRCGKRPGLLQILRDAFKR